MRSYSKKGNKKIYKSVTASCSYRKRKRKRRNDKVKPLPFLKTFSVIHSDRIDFLSFLFFSNNSDTVNHAQVCSYFLYGEHVIFIHFFFLLLKTKQSSNHQRIRSTNVRNIVHCKTVVRRVLWSGERKTLKA